MTENGCEKVTKLKLIPRALLPTAFRCGDTSAVEFDLIEGDEELVWNTNGLTMAIW